MVAISDQQQQQGESLASFKASQTPPAFLQDSEGNLSFTSLVVVIVAVVVFAQLLAIGIYVMFRRATKDLVVIPEVDNVEQQQEELITSAQSEENQNSSTPRRQERSFDEETSPLHGRSGMHAGFVDAVISERRRIEKQQNASSNNNSFSSSSSTSSDEVVYYAYESNVSNEDLMSV